MAATSAFRFVHGVREIRYAAGALDGLTPIAESHALSRVLLVIDAFFEHHPLAKRLSDLFAGVDVSTHAVPRHEPTTHTVSAARDALVAAQADGVVAVGGGSAIDTAKVARMWAANDGPLEALVGPQGVPMTPHPSLFVAIPTTAGTGSEVSDSAIVDRPGTGYKAVLRSPLHAASIALLDPELTLSAPHAVTASSGFDALTHAVEAYTSRAASVMTDPLALSGATLLAGNLARVCAIPDDVEARGACLVGSMQAGIAFNSAHLGLAHAIAGAMGALHHVPHGLANALALPFTMAFNKPTLGKKGEQLAALLRTEDVAEGLSQLRAEIGLDEGLDRYVEGDAARDDLAKAAMTSGQVKVNPRTPELFEVRAIIEAMRDPTGGAAPKLNL